MIYGDPDADDIISQYVTFTKVYNEQEKIHGRTRKVVEETIRICKDRDVLKEYLASREKEVVDIMMTLYDEEYIMRAYTKDVAREAVKSAVENLIKSGKMSLEEIASCFTELSFDDVKAIEAEMKQPI